MWLIGSELSVPQASRRMKPQNRRITVLAPLDIMRTNLRLGRRPVRPLFTKEEMESRRLEWVASRQLGTERQYRRGVEKWKIDQALYSQIGSRK